MDTGASVSVTNTKDLPLGIKPTLTDFVKLITTNGSSLELLGSVNIVINLKIFNFSIQCTFAKNLVGYSLLGTDFIDTCKANIDFVEKQMTLTKVQLF